MPTFSKSVRNHALGSLCFRNHKQPRSTFLTYTQQTICCPRHFPFHISDCITNRGNACPIALTDAQPECPLALQNNYPRIRILSKKSYLITIMHSKSWLSFKKCLNFHI